MASSYLMHGGYPKCCIGRKQSIQLDEPAAAPSHLNSDSLVVCHLPNHGPRYHISADNEACDKFA